MENAAVNPLSIACMFVSLLVIVLFPLGLMIYLYKKEKISLKAVLAGALVFIVTQFLTRIPLLTWLGGQPWFRELSVSSLLFSAVFIGGFTAGLFEETGRYLGFRYLLKKELSWKNGVAFGIGHGGIEALGLVGLTYVNNIVISVMINTGLFDSYVVPRVGAEMAAYIKSQLIGLPPAMFLVGGLERLLAMIVQIGLSLVVLYGVMNRKISCLVYAILLHTLLNAPPVIMVQQGFSIWLAELYIFMAAVVALVYIQKSRERFERISLEPPL